MVIAKKSGIAGWGVYADESVRKAETILEMTGKRMTSKQIDVWLAKNKLRNDDWFQIADDAYLLLDPIPNFINHSCNPNAGIRGENQLVALRAIKKGEELFYDYSSVVGSDAPDESPWVMKCRCGGSNCRKRIGNWETLPARQLAKYKRVNASPTYILKQVKTKSPA